MISLYKNNNQFLWSIQSDAGFFINMWSKSPVLNSYTNPIRHNQYYLSLDAVLHEWPNTVLIGSAKNYTTIVNQFPELFI